LECSVCDGTYNKVPDPDGYLTDRVLSNVLGCHKEGIDGKAAMFGEAL